jgi:Undecaprenyl-phosphate glucose phosphotransferase
VTLSLEPMLAGSPNDERVSRIPRFGPFRSLLVLVDVACVGSAGILANVLADALRPDAPVIWPPHSLYEVPILFAALVAPAILNWFGVYRSWRGRSLDSELRPIAFGLGATFLLLLAIGVVTQSTAYYSRLWMAVWPLLAFGQIACARVALRATLASLYRRGFDTARVALIGDGMLAERVAHHLIAQTDSGFKPVGYFSLNPEAAERIPLPRLGTLQTLGENTERAVGQEIDQVWIVLPLSAENQIRQILHELRHSTIDIRMIPDVFGYQLLNSSTENVVGLPVLNLSYSPISGANRFDKDVLDRVLALGILVLILPFMLLIALTIKLESPGPAIFRQMRHGGDGRPFTVYKFRTMRQEAGNATAAQQATRNDVRITTLGRLLRRTSIDELPQFVNVLQGNMSIVGPRPHPIELNDLFREQVERYMWRHKVKPGITGWAQINGLRGETDTLDKMRKRIEFDLYYIDHWSLWFDIKIILLTVVRGFTGHNAY